MRLLWLLALTAAVVTSSGKSMTNAFDPSEVIEKVEARRSTIRSYHAVTKIGYDKQGTRSGEKVDTITVLEDSITSVTRPDGTATQWASVDGLAYRKKAGNEWQIIAGQSPSSVLIDLSDSTEPIRVYGIDLNNLTNVEVVAEARETQLVIRGVLSMSKSSSDQLAQFANDLRALLPEGNSIPSNILAIATLYIDPVEYLITEMDISWHHVIVGEDVLVMEEHRMFDQFDKASWPSHDIP